MDEGEEELWTYAISNDGQKALGAAVNQIAHGNYLDIHDGSSRLVRTEEVHI